MSPWPQCWSVLCAWKNEGLNPFQNTWGFAFSLVQTLLCLHVGHVSFLRFVIWEKAEKQNNPPSFMRDSVISLPDLYVQLVHKSSSLLIWYHVFQLYQHLSHLMCLWAYSGMRICDNIFSTAEMCIFFQAYIIKNGWKRLWLSFLKNSN